jgi:hypothetical protein
MSAVELLRTRQIDAAKDIYGTAINQVSAAHAADTRQQRAARAPGQK